MVRRRWAAACAALGTAMVPLPARAAEAGVAVVALTASFDQPLDLVPKPVSLVLIGSGAFAGTDGVRDEDCTFQGFGVADSLWSGTGGLGGSCGEVTFPLCVYQRVGVVMALACGGADRDPRRGSSRSCPTSATSGTRR